jgi:hypothetical protein
MKTSPLILRSLLILCALVLFVAPASAGTRFGGGLHYLKTVGDIKDTPEFDDSAFGFLGSVEFGAGSLLRVDADLEVIPDYAGSSEIMWQPQGYLLIGDFIYGGAGIGIGYLGDFGWQDPFYALRAGVDFPLGSVDLDIFASYRFQTAKDLEGLGSDDMNSITFGAIVRFGD